MRYAVAAILLFTTYILSPSLWAAGGENQVFIGDGLAFGVSPPKGWIGAKPDFAPVLFHPSQFPEDASPVVIYVRLVSKAEVGAATPAELNAIDLKGMREQWPKVNSTRGEVLRSREKVPIPTYRFTGAKYLELVAYADHPKTIIVIVLSAETKESFSSSIGHFDMLCPHISGYPNSYPLSDEAVPNKHVKLTAEQRCCSVPSALRAPAAAYVWR